MDDESKEVLKWTVLLGLGSIIMGCFLMFGESIWAPQSVEIREKAIRESSTYIDGRVADLRSRSIEICSPNTPEENIDGLVQLFNATADELDDATIPDDLQGKVALARAGQSFCN
jgi:hypothetical protein